MTRSGLGPRGRETGLWSRDEAGRWCPIFPEGEFAFYALAPAAGAARAASARSCSWGVVRSPYADRGRMSRSRKRWSSTTAITCADDGIDPYTQRRQRPLGVRRRAADVTCHGVPREIWPASPELRAVRASYFEDFAHRRRAIDALPIKCFNHAIQPSPKEGGVRDVQRARRSDGARLPGRAAVLSDGLVARLHRAPEDPLPPRRAESPNMSG